MLRAIFLISVAVWLNSCVPIESHRDKAMKWLGHHVDNLVLNWGPPHSTFTLSDGSRVIQYKKEWTENEYHYRDYRQEPYIIPVPKKCYINFFVDTRGFVKDFANEGDCW
ncbi:MAG: hypothetical protein NZT61_00360 [Deltaproteobacteria bacterium]|nr:hypothetical protein [Deltaproteobacteria bacterium]MCX7952829.1 hypothetical protein [Deltaproteobacteria bacterium]